ncbi:MAG: hypothetical protein ACRDBR_02160 [Metamycoplasmataceae bacterium]
MNKHLLKEKNDFISKRKKSFWPALAFIKLLNKQFIFSKEIIFYLYFFDLILLIFFSQIILLTSFPAANVLFVEIISNIIIFGLITTAIQVLPSTILYFKNSTLIKLIKVSSVSSFTFFSSVISYYFILIISQLIWNFAWFFALFGWQDILIGETTYKIFDLFFGAQSQINWLSYIFVIFYLEIFTISIGIFISAISKNNIQMNIFSSIIIYWSIIFGSQIFIKEFSDKFFFISLFSYITPLRYINNFLILAINGESIFNIFLSSTQPFIDLGLKPWEVHAGWLIPIILTFFLIIFSIKKMRWNNR